MFLLKIVKQKRGKESQQCSKGKNWMIKDGRRKKSTQKEDLAQSRKNSGRK